MSIDVQLTKATVNALKAKLKLAREGLQNDGVVMRQVAVFLDQWVQRNFQSEGGKVGGWPRFKYGGRVVSKKGAKTQSIEGHRYIDSSAKLLQDTGALRHSFLPFVRKGVAGIGSDLPYAETHEKGKPQRRMLMKTEDVQVDLREIMDNWLLLTIKRAQ